MLYDAVAIIPSVKGAALLATQASAKDFINDAHAHCKFVGYAPTARALFDAAGVTAMMDEGYLTVDAKKSTATAFIRACRQLRHWDREPTVKSV